MRESIAATMRPMFGMIPRLAHCVSPPTTRAAAVRLLPNKRCGNAFQLPSSKSATIGPSGLLGVIGTTAPDFQRL
jgi:hypothetical protein